MQKKGRKSTYRKQLDERVDELERIVRAVAKIKPAQKREVAQKEVNRLLIELEKKLKSLSQTGE